MEVTYIPAHLQKKKKNNDQWHRQSRQSLLRTIRCMHACMWQMWHLTRSRVCVFGHRAWWTVRCGAWMHKDLCVHADQKLATRAQIRRQRPRELSGCVWVAGWPWVACGLEALSGRLVYRAVSGCRRSTSRAHGLMRLDPVWRDQLGPAFFRAVLAPGAGRWREASGRRGAP